MTYTPAVSGEKLFSKAHFINGNQHSFNLFWLLLLSCSLILLGLGLRDPWPADEPRFALIAKEMVDSGQWFFPMRGGELYPDKPPIFMWSIALFYWLTGSITLAFLLPSALCGIATVMLVYDLGRRLWSNQVGWYAALLLLLSLQFMLQAKTAQIDAMVCCWITIGCYGLIRFLLLGGGWRWYFLAWFFMGIGVITKGVGFLPLLMLLPYGIIRIANIADNHTNQVEKPRSWYWILGPVVMLGAISLWFLPMLYLVEHYQQPLFTLYRDNILFRQTVTRYADSWHHLKPMWYYIISVIPVFWLPISLMLPWLVKHWKQAIGEGDRRIILPLGWIVLVLIFFSLSPGKRGVYILPALPMLALVTAPYLRHVLCSKWFNRLILTVVAAISLALLMFGIAGQLDMAFASKLSTRYELEPWNFLMAVGASGALICMLTVRSKQFLSWLWFIPVLWIFYSTWGYTLLNQVKTPKSIFTQMAQFIPDNAELALVNFSEQFILFSPYATTHFGYHTPDDQEVRAAWRWQQGREHGVILIDGETQTDCFDMQQGIPLGLAHRVNWVLLTKDARLGNCAVPDSTVVEYRTQPKK
ncbi:MAG: 4-amino-4-deoxy-L-arabinose transferase-like glycosyltransferase [Paraglaciecola sp.]|jgi:4-amino-4-deoxy-L-arabinose transferase-like glycosyltransferase